MAQSISVKVGTIKSNTDSESKEISEFRSSLLKLGLQHGSSTQKVESDHIQNLSSQIDDFLTGVFKTMNNKMLSTVDLYCMFNRIRGLSKIVS